MIYGAYGYTGKLIAEEAVRRGYRPLLAGRSEEKLAPLAEQLGLESVAVGLDDAKRLRDAVEPLDLVLHAAGPFVRTSAAMVEACLAAGTDYLDISGELPVLRHTYACDHEAREETVLLVSGAGFDVIPTDCLAMLLKQRLPDAVELEIAVNAGQQPSPGTLVASLEVAREGGWIRRNGELVPYTLGKGGRRQRFTNGEAMILPLPIGDLESAFRSTGIPNITTYLVVPRGLSTALRVAAPILRAMFHLPRVLRLTERIVHSLVKGPDEKERVEGRSYLWACARNADGKQVEAWLDTMEAYRFTAVAAVRAVEQALQQKRAGALAPAQAFGPEFIMSIEETVMYEKLPGKK